MAQSSYGFEPYAVQQIITRYGQVKDVTNSPNRTQLGAHAEHPLPPQFSPLRIDTHIPRTVGDGARLTKAVNLLGFALSILLPSWATSICHIALKE